MQSSTPYITDSTQLAIIQKKLLLDNKFRGGVNWFFWIAGLSILNTIIYFMGSTISFAVGLGVTQLMDAFMNLLAKDLGSSWNLLRGIGLSFDFGIACGFVLLGFLGRRRYHWPIILGVILYALDGVILLVFQVYLGGAFHALGLIGILTGLKSLYELETLEKLGNSESIESLRQRMPELQPRKARNWKTSLFLVLAIFLVILLGLVVSSLQ